MGTGREALFGCLQRFLRMILFDVPQPPAAVPAVSGLVGVIRVQQVLTACRVHLMQCELRRKRPLPDTTARPALTCGDRHSEDTATRASGPSAAAGAARRRRCCRSHRCRRCRPFPPVRPRPPWRGSEIEQRGGRRLGLGLGQALLGCRCRCRFCGISCSRLGSDICCSPPPTWVEACSGYAWATTQCRRRSPSSGTCPWARGRAVM